MDNRFVIIDGNSLLNRAYYAMRNPMITKEGIYTQGIYGFLNMLNKIKKDYEPEYIVVTFDKKAPTFRHKQFQDYKAGRKKMPEELAMEIPYLKDILKAMNIEILEKEGFEADDLIGTLAKKGEEKGLISLIITGDKDALQLATEKTEVLITKKGISVFELYNKTIFEEKYGFSPTEFIDVKGLMGDQSDNIPGVSGIGEKTAHKLIIQYKSIENLYENIDELPKNKMREKLEAEKTQAFMSKMLATIDTDVPIDEDLSIYKIKEADLEALKNIYVKLEFNSFLKNFKDIGNSKNDNSENVDSKIKEEIDKKEKIIINDLKELEKYFSDINSEENIYIKIFSDYNHKNVSEIYGIGVMSTKRVAYISIDDNIEAVRFVGNQIIEKRLKISGHFLTQDYFIILSFLENDNSKKSYLFETSFDSSISRYVLEPNSNKYSIDVLALEELQVQIDAPENFIKENSQVSFIENYDGKYLDYFKNWVTVVAETREIHTKKLKENNLENIFYDIELPLIEVLASMEVQGIEVDKNQLKEIGDNLSIRIENLKEEIYKYAETEFNINSPMQLGDILFEKLKLPAGKKNKSGYSTSADILNKIKDKHPIIPNILEYRGLSKLKSTYVDGLVPLIDENNKIHAHFQQTGTATGRLSCTEPNLQNIPIKHEDGRVLRKVFIPKRDNVFLGADYSQIELRILAHLSGEEHLIEAFNNNDDIHSITASRVFKVPQEEVDSIMRSNAKAVNFGVIYGMSGFGLSEELNITIKEAEKYIKEYFNTNPKVKIFMDNQIESGKKNGYVETLYGRKRYIREINASNYMVRQMGERLAMNSPVQGTAADIIKIAMINVYRKLKENNLNSKLVLQVHDELIIEADKREEDIATEILKEAMINAVDLKIKLTVDFHKGDNWYNLK